MAEHDESNFGNADGGGIPTLGHDVTDSGAAELPGGATDPASFTKRGRGRPRKDAGDSGSATGAKQQAGKSQGKAQTKLDVSLFARQIEGAHQMLALVSKNPIWVIDSKAAESLAQSLLDVMSHHSINVNPATISYMKLIGVCAAIYGPKLLQIKTQNDRKRAEENRTVEMPS